VRVAYFDAIGGAAGDMILGALIDAGLDIASLQAELRKLDLRDVEIRADRVSKRRISAAQFEVSVAGVDERFHDHDHSPEQHGRALADIRKMIGRSGIAESAKRRSLAIFDLIGRAEARIHGVALDEVHFHEIGAIDSIVDIVGSALAVDLMGLEALFCSPLPVGSGFVKTSHGQYPVPAPATLEILATAGVPTRPSRVEAEQVTPTGAAILAALATFEQPPIRPRQIGYGAGHADLDIPNVLRVWIGEADPGPVEPLVIVETSVDDMSPELSAHIVSRCLEAGALDALLIPVIMKKGRPGVKIEVLCPPERRQDIQALLLTETTTFGVRWWGVTRMASQREHRSVQTPFGSVTVKLRLGPGGEREAFPEFEDCRRAAQEAGVPLARVYRAAILAAESAE
jgi:pyridinium-3,5-bisthiocarboxylic acid mononucleotide nickel chelatase